jgi:hypothetical protein
LNETAQPFGRVPFAQEGHLSVEMTSVASLT